MSEPFRISNISIAINVNRTIIEWGEGRSGGWRDYAVATRKRRIKCQDILKKTSESNYSNFQAGSLYQIK